MNVIIHAADRIAIGRRCSIASFVHVWGGGGVTFGDDVMVASHTVITSVTHDKHARCFRETPIKAPVIIGNYVWVGAGAIILQRVNIGDNSIIGAGALVTKDVPTGSVFIGISARNRNQ